MSTGRGGRLIRQSPACTASPICLKVVGWAAQCRAADLHNDGTAPGSLSERLLHMAKDVFQDTKHPHEAAVMSSAALLLIAHSDGTQGRTQGLRACWMWGASLDRAWV